MQKKVSDPKIYGYTKIFKCWESFEYIAVKEDSQILPELYGKFTGKTELLNFFNHLKEYYKNLEFRIDSIGENQNNVFVKGYLKYEIVKNKKIYDTHWMAHIMIKENKIKEYRFFKDTAFLEEQFSKN